MNVTVPLGEVTSIHSDSINPQKYPETWFELYSIPGFDNNKTPERLTGLNIRSNKTVLPDRGVLFSKLNPRINRVWLINECRKALRISSTEFICLVPNEKYLNSDFLAWRLRIPNIAKHLSQSAAAATKSRERIQPKSLLRLLILLPPLDEQQRIVDILNRTAHIERLRDRAGNNLRDFTPALFVKMFGNPVTNPMDWDVVRLGDLCDMNRQGIQPNDPLAARLPFVGVENVVSGTGSLNFTTNSRTGNQKSTAFRFDDRHVLYGKLRPYLNKVATPEFAGRCSTELVPLLPCADVDRYFLANLLRHRDIVEFVMASVTGARMPRADMKTLLAMPVPLPPFDKQRRFADIVKRVSRTTTAMQSASKSASALRTSLMSRFFKNGG